MTNKEILSKFVAEMRVAKNAKNENLAKIDEMGLPASVAQQAKEAIRKNFVDKLEEIKSKPWYAEVKQTHAEEIKAKIELSKSKKEKERLQKEYEEALKKADADISDKNKVYEDAQIAHRWKVEELSENDAENVWEFSQEKKEKLYWNREAIIKDLKENYLKEDDAEMMWYKWKEVHFSLPAVWNFEWFKLDYFVSNEPLYKRDFESNPELEKKSKSMKQIWEILKAMNRYMAELWVKTDDDTDYEKDLQIWIKGGKSRCKAWDCLKDIPGLDKWYWTSDKGVDGREDSRIRWNCSSDRCYFSPYGLGLNAYLFLGLSD